jgi:PAB1-binding protein PBP1
MDLYSNDVSHTSSEERTASVSSLYSNNNRNNNGNNRQPDSDPLAVKLKQIADIESRYKQLPQKRKPENVLRAKRFLK